jgi:RHH-type transcriptional regulator, rel operon repressor / antitoxin RelB
MIGLRDPELEMRLENLAKATGRSKSFYVREAIAEYLQDREDYLLGIARLEEGGKRFTLEEVEKKLGLER